MKQQQKINDIIKKVENDFSSFYGFSPKVSAEDFLVSSLELKNLFNRSIHGSETKLTNRGGVWVFQEGDKDELFIGVNFSDSIVKKLLISNPFDSLSDFNLDEFCVLIEELSHFHLILNRIEMTFPSVSRLELEWQGEIDKLLFSAIVLKEQCGDPHFLPLVRTIFDLSRFHSNDKIYEIASNYAARFWYNFINLPRLPEDLLRDAGFRRLLQRLYFSPWEDKARIIAKC